MENCALILNKSTNKYEENTIVEVYCTSENEDSYILAIKGIHKDDELEHLEVGKDEIDILFYECEDLTGLYTNYKMKTNKEIFQAYNRKRKATMWILLLCAISCLAGLVLSTQITGKAGPAVSIACTVTTVILSIVCTRKLSTCALLRDRKVKEAIQKRHEELLEALRRFEGQMYY